jgi:hypothetical protein
LGLGIYKKKSADLKEKLVCYTVKGRRKAKSCVSQKTHKPNARQNEIKGWWIAPDILNRANNLLSVIETEPSTKVT